MLYICFYAVIIQVQILINFIIEALHRDRPGLNCDQLHKWQFPQKNNPKYNEVSKMKLEFKRIGFLKTSDLFFSPGLILVFSGSLFSFLF
jgi:hypothetical protein